MTRPLTAAEVPGVVALLAERRRADARYSPVFWNPAVGVEDLHALFLTWTLEQPDTISICNDDGFLIGQIQDRRLFIDDFAVATDAAWSHGGATLLCEAFDRASARTDVDHVRVVTAAEDLPKRQMLLDQGLQLGSRWWVAELKQHSRGSSPDPDQAAVARHDVDGITLHVVDSPPVYDPGGVVTQVFNPPLDKVDGLLRAATNLGATLLIVSEELSVADSTLAAALPDKGFCNASQFFDGAPSHS